MGRINPYESLCPVRPTGCHKFKLIGPYWKNTWMQGNEKHTNIQCEECRIKLDAVIYQEEENGKIVAKRRYEPYVERNCVREEGIEKPKSL